MLKVYTVCGFFDVESRERFGQVFRKDARFSAARPWLTVGRDCERLGNPRFSQPSSTGKQHVFPTLFWFESLPLLQKNNRPTPGVDLVIFAERERFELSRPFPVCRFSKPVLSTTQPPLQC